MSSSEQRLNGIGDSVRVESVAGLPPLSDVSGDEDHHKDNLDDMQSHLPDSEKVIDSEDEHRNSSPRLSTQEHKNSTPRLSTEDGVKQVQDSAKEDSVKQDEESIEQDELLFYPSPHGSYETDLDSAEQQEANIRQILHLGPTNSLTRASSILDNYGFAEWGTYLFTHGLYMAFLSFIYLILVYASLELLYYMTNTKST